MSRIQFQITSLALLALLSVVVLTSCSGSGTLVGPDPNDAAVAFEWAWDECPAWEEACDQGIEELCSECPPDADWKNRSQYNACIKKTVRVYLKQLRHCFSEEDLDTLRDCILDDDWEIPEDQEANREQKFRED